MVRWLCAWLFYRHSSTVYRYLAAVYESPTDAEVVTQEAFLALCAELQARRRIRNPRVWTMVRATRLMDSRPMVGPIVRPPVGAGRAAVMDSLRKMEPPARKSLVARSQGLTLVEIAEVVGVPPFEAAALLARAVNLAHGAVAGAVLEQSVPDSAITSHIQAASPRR